MGINYYDGTTLHEYYFVKNLQGDVTAIRDWNGNLIATYIYDAWGNLMSLTDGTGTPITSTTHIGYINPIRYRGYYYDVETGLYYLQSRYYDAKICRFISPDGYISTGQGVLGNNMFAYCGNNPVNRMDESGKCWRWIDNVVNLLKKAVNRFKIQLAKNNPNNIYHGSTEQDVCADGKNTTGVKNPYGDGSNCEETYYFGGDVAADEINYMVVPGEYAPSLMGCVGVVINNKTGAYAYGIVGDSGPKLDGSSGIDYGKSAWDEVSIRMAWVLNGHEFGAPIADQRQYGDYTYIIFTQSKDECNKVGITQSEIDAVGREYLWLY